MGEDSDMSRVSVRDFPDHRWILAICETMSDSALILVLMLVTGRYDNSDIPDSIGLAVIVPGIYSDDSDH